MLNWFVFVLVFVLFAFQPVFITKLLDDKIICSLNAMFFLQFDQTSWLMPVVCHTGMTYNWHQSGRLIELEKKHGIQATNYLVIQKFRNKDWLEGK